MGIYDLISGGGGYGDRKAQIERCANCEFANVDGVSSLSIRCMQDPNNPVIHSYDHLCMQFKAKGNHPNAL